MVSGRPHPDLVDRVGKLLYGRPLRLRVALWVLEQVEAGQSFFQSEAATGVGYSASGVTAELDRLIELGMLRRDEGDRKVFYTPLSSKLWETIEQTRDHMIEEVPISTQ